MMKKSVFMGIAALCMASCAAKKESPESSELKIVQAPARPVIGGEVREIPRAVIYKMNGDYADNVTIEVDAQGDIVSYPAPQDVKGMKPVALADGWYLSRQGVSSRSVFTRWTYEEYAALKAVPSIAQLKAAILPAAKITELKTLPISQSEALANPAEIIPEVNE